MLATTTTKNSALQNGSAFFIINRADIVQTVHVLYHVAFGKVDEGNEEREMLGAKTQNPLVYNCTTIEPHLHIETVAVVTKFN